MPEQPLAIRIYSDPALTDLVRLVGYRGIPYPMTKEDFDRLNAKYGKDRLVKAADELFDYDREKKLTKLKDEIRVLCRQLLGPMPEEWDSFYEGVTNPPPNPYKEKPAVANVPVTSSPVDEQPAESSEVELLRTTHGRQLRNLLLNEHSHFANYPPGHHFHVEAIRRMDLLEAEMRRRGNKIPPRPAVPLAGIEARPERVGNLEGTELMRRYFKAKEVLESENEHTGLWKQTKIEYDLLRTECERRRINLPPTGFDDPSWQFRKATTHRLKELLDMNQYEVAKYGPETVTYQDAERDIALIESELARRR